MDAGPYPTISALKQVAHSETRRLMALNSGSGRMTVAGRQRSQRLCVDEHEAGFTELGKCRLALGYLLQRLLSRSRTE